MSVRLLWRVHAAWRAATIAFYDMTGGPVLPATRFCLAMREWALVVVERERQDRATDFRVVADSPFERAWTLVEKEIRKSCLLDRTIYNGEHRSRTPCPVHLGRWSGLHFWASLSEEPTLRDWHARGCRCYMHSCGCTTGWQPDANCGCGVKE